MQKVLRQILTNLSIMCGKAREGQLLGKWNVFFYLSIIYSNPHIDDVKLFCQGDSGGPITYKGYLVGVVSFGGPQCGWSPGVYTRISSYTSGEYVPFVANHCIALALHNLLYIRMFIMFFLCTIYLI